MKVKLHTDETVECGEVRKMVMTPDKISGGRGKTAEQELDHKVKLLMAQTKRNYSEAMSVVLYLDADLKARWVRETLTNKARSK